MYSDILNQSMIGNAVILGGAILVMYRVALALYNVYFHPLSDYPGPWYRAAFWVPDDVDLLRGRSLGAAKSLHDRYGHVVRIAPDKLSYISARAWKDIYGYVNDRDQIPKDPKRWAEHMSNIIHSNDQDHARMRKHLNTAFSDHALQAQQPLLVKNFNYLITRLKDQLDDSGKAIVDIGRWYNFLTFDIIGEMCLGDSIGAMEDGKQCSHIDTMFEGIKFYRWILAAGDYPWLWPLIIYWTWGNPLAENFKRWLSLTEGLTRERIAKGPSDRNDFITYILQHDDKNGMTTSELVENSGILMTAGAETSAAGLTAATYYLIKHPRVLGKLRDEVLNTFASDEDIRIDTVGRLPYLNAVVQEVLRVYPPAAGIFARRTKPGGAMVDGRYVPGNVSLGVCQWAAHHSVANFANPDDFVPERWLPNAPAEYANDNFKAAQPFAYGPRNCIGQSLANFELRSILSRMVLNFDMEMTPEGEKWRDQEFNLLWEKKPLPIKLRARKV